jgi:hypothetical protein
MSSRERSGLPTLALAAALVVAVGARDAMAQTVIVRNAQPGAKIELATPAGAVASVTADTFGDATLTLPGGRQGDVRIFVDTCGNAIRVVFLAPGEALAAEAGCARKELWGIYDQRPITTFLVEMAGTDSSVYVAQGPPPAAWIRRGDEVATGIRWGRPSTGLAVSAGAGLSWFSRAVDVTCGDLPTCASTNLGGALSVGAEYWIARWVAAYGAYLKPADVTASGSGTAFRFDSRQQARLLTVGAKVGGPAGPARIYAMGGMVRHEATFTTTQTNDAVTVTVAGAPQTFPGGTQSFGDKTQGWSWTLGGGVEAWVAGRVAIYGEYSRAKLKGQAAAGTESAIDDQVSQALVGIRLRLLP